MTRVESAEGERVSQHHQFFCAYPIPMRVTLGQCMDCWDNPDMGVTSDRHLLVTGALGHIGSALIREPLLLQGFDRITMVDDLSTQRYSSLFSLPGDIEYTFLEGDVEERVGSNLVANADAVIHLAGTVDPVRSSSDPENLRANNLRITAHIASQCSQTQTPLVYVSSTSVYTPSGDLVDENSTELSPNSPYARCKLDEERLIANQLNENAYAIFRLGTIFGPSPGMRFQTAVNKFCWQAATGVPVNVWRTALNQVRPYLALSDCTRLLSQTVVKQIYPGRIVNAVTCNVTVADVLSCIRGQGLDVLVQEVESPIMNSLSFVASTSLATELGFEFSGDLTQEVAATLEILGRLGSDRG
jgi:UDP-glucose 4-epimerase